MSYVADIARSVSRYQPADRPALREFQREYFGAGSRQCDDAYFEWLFENNPYQGPDGPSLWICKRDGVVVGQQASIPVVLKAGDSELHAAWGMDLMVRPEWRLKGVAPALSAEYENSADVLLGGAMSDAARRAFLRRGWTDMGLLPFYVRPLDPVACSQTEHAPRFLAKLIPELATRGSAYIAGRLLGALHRTSLEPIERFDEDVDAIWARCSRDYGVLVKRDLKYLRWRFDEIPGRAAYRRYYLMRGGAAIGYAVTRLEPWRGSTVGRLIDYLAPRNALLPLLAAAIGELNAQRVAAVFVEQFHRSAEPALRALGCFRAPQATRFIFDAHGNAAAARGLLADASQWMVNLADSDMDHEAAYGPAPVLIERSEPVSSSA